MTGVTLNKLVWAFLNLLICCDSRKQPQFVPLKQMDPSSRRSLWLPLLLANRKLRLQFREAAKVGQYKVWNKTLLCLQHLFLSSQIQKKRDKANHVLALLLNLDISLYVIDTLLMMTRDLCVFAHFVYVPSPTYNGIWLKGADSPHRLQKQQLSNELNLKCTASLLNQRLPMTQIACDELFHFTGVDFSCGTPWLSARSQGVGVKMNNGTNGIRLKPHLHVWVRMYAARTQQDGTFLSTSNPFISSVISLCAIKMLIETKSAKRRANMCA